MSVLEEETMAARRLVEYLRLMDDPVEKELAKVLGISKGQAKTLFQNPDGIRRIPGWEIRVAHAYPKLNMRWVLLGEGKVECYRPFGFPRKIKQVSCEHILNQLKEFFWLIVIILLILWSAMPSFTEPPPAAPFKAPEPPKEQVIPFPKGPSSLSKGILPPP